jgi:hypothetical protein
MKLHKLHCFWSESFDIEREFFRVTKIVYFSSARHIMIRKLVFTAIAFYGLCWRSGDRLHFQAR